MRALLLLRAVAAAGVCAAALALVAGCTGKPPVISRVYSRVIYVRDSEEGTAAETLGVFLIASDPDGIENLSAFYVINDDAELFWKVDRSSWTTSTAEGESWIGTTSLSMPGSSRLPAGQYRVVLQDVGGDTVEDTFTVPARTVSASEAVYPTASVAGGVIKISGPFESCEVWAYGKDGKFAATFPAGGKSPALRIQSIAGSSPALEQGFTFRVFAWDEKGGYGVLSSPYPSASLPGP